MVAAITPDGRILSQGGREAKPVLVVGLSVVVGLMAAMAVAWLVQRATGNVGWVDVVWSLATGLAGCIAALGGAGHQPSPRQIVVAVLVASWSLGLAGHLVRRVSASEEDARYRVLRETWAPRFQSRLFWFLEIQALVSALLVVSILLAGHNPAPHWRLLDVAGVVVLIGAIAGERIADRQLTRFKAAARSHGAVCDVGLWAWSRHPNYFFEWLVWLAYPLFAVDLDGGYPWGWLAFLGPVLMYLLLVYVSGIPPLEQHMLRSRGAAFAAYQRRTSAFFPWPPSAAAADAPSEAG
jgi:steroid 5-alpha reductase family enzyme